VTIFRRAIRDRRRALLWWMLGLVALHLVTLAFFPTVRDQQNFDELVQQMPEALRAMFGMEDGVSLGSAAGYLWARLFSSLLTVLLVIYAIVGGAGAIGGSEEDGTLELILATPVSRLAVALQRFLAIAALLAALVTFSTAVLLLLAIPFSALEGISGPGFAAANAGLLALALLHASVAFAGGALTGRRGPGLAAGMVLAAGGFLAQGLLTAAGAPEWVRNLNPWYWYLSQNLLAFGARWEAVLPALVLAALPVAAGTAVFRRRDLH
jgi:ABC-2 type transport system permease protein